MITAKNGSLITGGLSVLIIGAVFLTAIIVRGTITGATFLEKYQKENNTNQSNTAPTNRSRSSLPENNYNSYSSSNSYSGSYNTANSYTATAPTPTPAITSNTSNNYSSNAENIDRSTSNKYSDLNRTSTTNTAPKQLKGRIKNEALFTVDGKNVPLQNGEIVTVICKSGDNYLVDTSYFGKGFINGYDFEFTSKDTYVENCTTSF